MNRKAILRDTLAGLAGALVGLVVAGAACHSQRPAPVAIESDTIRQYRASFHPRPAMIVEASYFEWTGETAQIATVMVRNDTLAFCDPMVVPLRSIEDEMTMQLLGR